MSSEAPVLSGITTEVRQSVRVGVNSPLGLVATHHAAV